MPHFSSAHLVASLHYLTQHTHPALMSVLAMLRKDLPASDNDGDAVRYGSPDENRLMSDYFKPIGGPDGNPYFVPFGAHRGTSRWRDTAYAGRSLQRQRGDKSDVFRKHSSDNRRWSFTSGFAEAIQVAPAEVVGTIPLQVAYLAVWCYRDRAVASLPSAIAEFASEFNIEKHGLVPKIFVANVPNELSEIPMAAASLDHAELLTLLQAIEPDRPEPNESAIARNASIGSSTRVVAPGASAGDWGASLEDLGDLGGLKGVEEATLRAVAALNAGFHVILTGPPGAGKTQLATRICERAGFASWTVPATDQWTTFETIGGYFPMPPENGGAGDRLDFHPGAVVASLESEKCLIIDEINRADIDKAFGELFTLLSGNSVTLPYRRRSMDGRFRHVRLQVGPAVVDDDLDVIVVPPWWRIIGSMNDADKASLKRLSMAFVRRFAFIPIDLPPPAVYADLIRARAARTEASAYGFGAMEELCGVLIELFCNPDAGLSGIGLPLGPGFPLAIIQHADSEWSAHHARGLAEVLCSSIELFVMPQLQGRADLHDEALDMVMHYLPASSRRSIAQHLAVWTGYIPE